MLSVPDGGVMGAQPDSLCPICQEVLNPSACVLTDTQQFMPSNGSKAEVLSSRK